jgi:hypothetical protein
MKLRLTQAGFENYTGQMGVVMFKDGLSEGDVLPIDAIRISAAIGADWEDGTAANVGDMYLNNMDAPAHIGGGVIRESDEVEQVEEGAATQVVAGTVYSKDDLAKIADADGIAGLRAIAEPMGVKGTSIVGLIEAILKKQGPTE